MANSIMHSRKAVAASSRGGYRARDASLKRLGFLNYEEYLASEEWRGIRSDCLDKHPECCMCIEVATQVHHFSYESGVLLGMFPDLLFSVCDDCHHLIEFNGERKRTLGQSQSNLIAWFALNNPRIADNIHRSMKSVAIYEKRLKRT